MTRTPHLKVSSAIHARSRLRKTALVVAMIVSGAAAFAAPTVYNESFTLSTSNQSMWGTGAQTGWSYDSGVQGVKWGTYVGPGHGPETIGVNAVTGSSDTTIIPRICVPTLWGDICTGAVTADTRTGADLNLASSGQLGVGVNASATGGGVSVVLPVKTYLQIGDAVDGKFHVGGSAVVDTLKGGASISATAPSFAAGIKGIANVDAKLNAEGCLIFLGCSSGGAQVGFGFNQTLVSVDTLKDKPVSLLGIDLGVPAVNSYYQIKKGEPPCVGPIGPDGKKPDCANKGPLAFGGLNLAQVEFDTLKNFSGGNYNQYANLLTLSNNSPVLHADLDLIGIAQAAYGLQTDVVNPSVKLNIPVVGSSVSAAIKLADVQAGIVLGLEQSFAVTPNLQVTLQFDKPVTEYVQVVDYINKDTLIGYKNPISFDLQTTVVNEAYKAYQQSNSYPTQEVFDTLIAGGCHVYKSSDYDGRVNVDHCAPYKQSYGATCIGSSDAGCQVNPGQDVILGKDEPFRLDLPYYTRQCRIVDAIARPWDPSQEANGSQHAIDCYTPAVLAAQPVYADVTVYKTVMVERGTTVTVDMDKGTDLRFTGDAGHLIGRSYTMDDSDNFQSTTGISVGFEAYIQAACLKAQLISLSVDACALDKSFNLPFGDINVFDQKFALTGFNSVAFGEFSGPSGPGGSDVPEPSTIWLAALAMLSLGAFSRHQSRRI